MKLLTMAAATFAVLFAPKMADALVPQCYYDTINVPGNIANFTLTPGAQFGGDVFTPVASPPNNGQLGEVEGVFVDTTGGNYTITVDIWNNQCLGCVGTGNIFSATFNLVLPPITAPTAYIITFPVGCIPFNPPPNTPISISFYVAPPGAVPIPPNPCPVGVAPTLVPAFNNVVPLCGVGRNGFSLDIRPQDCCLRPNFAGCPAGMEWFNFTATPAWTNGNMLVSLYDCTPQPTKFHGPLALQEAMVRKLDIPVKQHKSLIDAFDVDMAKR